MTVAIARYRYTQMRADTDGEFTVYLTVAAVRVPPLEQTLCVRQIEINMLPRQSKIREAWVEEFASEADADAFLAGCRAAFELSGVTGFPKSVADITNYGVAVE